MNTLPQFGSAIGWVSRRQRRASSIAARIVGRVARRQREPRPDHHGAGRQRAAPVGEARLVGLDRSALDIESANTSTDVDDVGASRRRAHPRSSGPPRPGSRGSPPRTPARRARAASATPASAGSGIAAPAVIVSPSRAVQRKPFPSRSTNPGKPSSATRTFEPLPSDDERHPRSADRLGGGGEVALVVGLQIERGGSADPEGGERRHREARPGPGRRRPPGGSRVASVEVAGHPRLLDPFAHRVAEHPHVAAPHRDDEVARRDRRRQEVDHVAPMRQVHGAASRARRAATPSATSSAGDAGDRRLAGAVDVGHDDEVRRRDARAELAPQRLRRACSGAAARARSAGAGRGAAPSSIVTAISVGTCP